MFINKEAYLKQSSINEDELAHIGVIGMKWGTRRTQKKADKLTRRVDKSIRRFDRGSNFVNANTFREQSRKARRLTYKTNKRIARINRYLNRSKDESVNNLIFKFKKNPQKIARAKDYLARSEMTAKRLSELRTSLIDIKIDTL